MNPSRDQVEALIAETATRYKLSVEVCMRQCQAESAFDQSARSSCGALGLYQLMPATAKGLGVDPLDWRDNVAGGIKYLSQMNKQFGCIYKALAAYNWGPGNLKKCIAKHGENWRDHLPLETKNYLRKILGA